ncbi:MAG: DUF1579 domain-containing protein [Candidatus Kapaibacterium sp.]
MKKLKLFILLALLFPVLSFAQTEDEMKKWGEYMTPGKEHESLAKMDGDWIFTSKMWMDPKGEPTVSEGTAVCKMILGGRYSQMDVKGDIMGMPFNGTSLLAFDNGKKIYLTTWIDNMGTGIMYGEGKYDEASKAVILKGKMYDPLAGKDIDYKEIMKWTDEKTMTLESFTIKDGMEIKNMEITYTKK